MIRGSSRAKPVHKARPMAVIIQMALQMEKAKTPPQAVVKMLALSMALKQENKLEPEVPEAALAI